MSGEEAMDAPQARTLRIRLGREAEARLERVLAADPREQLRPEALAGWLKGLELLRERLLEHFAEEGIRPMATLGEPFDPHLHLAFGTVPPDPGHPAGTIVREARPGYLLGDTVLRYAEVVVAK
jgi:molecular chaperone GrpE